MHHEMILTLGNHDVGHAVSHTQSHYTHNDYMTPIHTPTYTTKQMLQLVCIVMCRTYDLGEHDDVVVNLMLLSITTDAAGHRMVASATDMQARPPQMSSL